MPGIRFALNGWALGCWCCGAASIVACASSETTLGFTAGAGGLSATAGAGVGGANANGAAGTGTAGKSPSSAGSGGTPSGGASSVDGGASGVSGAPHDSAGASSGGSGGSACVTDVDCTNDGICVYKVAEACSAHGSCVPRPAKGPVCSTIYCGCPTSTAPAMDVNVNCESPAGYARAPVKAPKGSTACP